MICSLCTLDQELAKILSIFIDNGFPINAIKRTVKWKIKRFKKPVTFGPFLCLLYLELPWLGRHSHVFSDNVSACITSSFSTVLFFQSRYVFLSFVKDGLPYLQNSFGIYKFKYHCDAAQYGPVRDWRPVSVNTFLQIQERVTLVDLLGRPKQCMIQQQASTFRIILTVHINIQMIVLI